MANIENTNNNNNNPAIDLSQLSPEEQTALERMVKRTDKLRYTYQDKVQELAQDGVKDGFWISIVDYEAAKPNGELVKSFRVPRNPITGKEEPTGKRVWRKERFYYQGQMTTEEYNQFATFRGKMLKESDTETSEDMTTRLYEYGAMKFLDMDHDMYVRAKKDEVRMAVDACLHISSWNGQIGELDDDEVSMNPVDRDIIEEKTIKFTPKEQEERQEKVSSYYKAPDEE